MADRDLLNKLIHAAAVERPAAERSTPPPAAVGKLGVRERAREIGREPSAEPLRLPDKGAPGKGAAGPRGLPAAPAAMPTPAPAREAPAFKAAYFNQDVATTQQVNLAARPQKALRGEEGATDLRRVVLPRPAAAEAPGEPAVLAAALERMAPSELGDSALAGLVAKQNEWSQKPSVRPETIAARQAMLEAMVDSRRAALSRMRALPAAAHALSCTIAQALGANGQALAAAGSAVENAGNALIERSESRAAGLRARLAKVLRSAI